jgi:hypothetical protein
MQPETKNSGGALAQKTRAQKSHVHKYISAARHACRVNLLRITQDYHDVSL